MKKETSISTEALTLVTEAAAATCKAQGIDLFPFMADFLEGLAAAGLQAEENDPQMGYKKELAAAGYTLEKCGKAAYCITSTHSGYSEVVRGIYAVGNWMYDHGFD